MVEQLSHQHIPYRIAGGGSQILVPADQVPQARLALAKEGLPSGGSVGYEIFDRGDGLAATEFQQQINQTRALEGELARTIRAMHGVRAVRVHLVLPRREPFARDRQEAQAGVMLSMVGVGRLDHEGVQAILNLVAAAVPGLRPQNIAIVDSRGDLLARAGEPLSGEPGAGNAAAAVGAEELRRATELRLARAVEEMLERSLGAGHVRAEAAVRMNFDKVNQTEERYDPDGQVTRSTQSVTTNNKSTEASTAVTVQNNLPNADAGREGAGSQEARQEETTNYEISRTVRTLIREQPQIDRISLAVMVDGTDSTDASGKHAWQPRTGEELDRITALVKSAIGYDEKRGDHVEVASMRFATEEIPRGREQWPVRRAVRERRLAASGADRTVRCGGGAGAAAGAAADGAAADHARSRRRGRRRGAAVGRCDGRAGRPRACGVAGGAGARLGRGDRAAGGREHGEHRAGRGADAGLVAAQDRRAGGEAPGGDIVDRARLDGAGERVRC